MKNSPPTRQEQIASLKVQVQYHMNFADLSQGDRALCRIALDAAKRDLEKLNELLLAS